MQSSTERILTYMFENRRQYTIPVYQRNYDWNKDNCETLFKDIKNLVNSEKKHFLGTVVQVQLEERNGIKRYLIIDGQQRFTTLFLFIKALRDCSTREMDQEACDEKLFNIDKFKDWSKDEQSRLKLKPIKTDNDQLLLLMNGKKEQMDKKSNILINYEYFVKLIGESIQEGLSTKDFLYGLERLEVVMITLNEDKGDEPQVVFERINSTGLDLTLGDLVRNYVLMTDDNAEELYNKYWINIEDKLGRDRDSLSGYFVDYFNFLLPDSISYKNAYESFKKYAIKNELSHETILSNMDKYVKYYAAFIKESDEYSLEINEKLSSFRTMKQSTIFPFLLNVFDDFEEGIITEDILNELLSFFISYAVRRYITGVGSNSLRGFYKTLYKRIFADETLRNKEDYLKAVYSFMLQLNTKDAVPSDSQFKNGLINEKIYEKDGKICKFILCSIENFNSKEKVDPTALITIEHIMPQAEKDNWRNEIGPDYELVHEKYLHTLGNLTLTGYNSELGTKDFKDKVQMIKDKKSKVVVLNEDIYLAEKWNKSAIEKRANRLADIMLKIFPLPKLAEQINFKNLKDDQLTFNDVDKVRKTKPTSFICLGERIIVDSYSDMLTKVITFLYDMDAKNLENAGNNNFKLPNADRIYVTYDMNLLRRPKEIKNSGIYFETNLSSTNILSFIREIFYIYNLSENDFIFYVDESSEEIEKID